MIWRMPAIPPNANVTLSLSGTTEAERPSLAGLVLYDEIVSHVFAEGSGSTTVNLQLRVVRSTATGLLDFYYRIIATQTFASPVSFVVEASLAGLVYTYADFRPDGSGTMPPIEFQIFPQDEVNHPVYKFFFATGMTAGESTRFFFVSSNATEFSPVACEINNNVNTNPCPGPTGF